MQEILAKAWPIASKISASSKKEEKRLAVAEIRQLLSGRFEREFPDRRDDSFSRPVIPSAFNDEFEASLARYFRNISNLPFLDREKAIVQIKLIHEALFQSAGYRIEMTWGSEELPSWVFNASTGPGFGCGAQFNRKPYVEN